MTVEHVHTHMDIEALEAGPPGSEPRHVSIRECSALKGEGVWEGLSELLEMINEQEEF